MRLPGLLLLCTSMCWVVTAQAQRPAKPNFVLILADDLGWQDPKIYDLMETNLVNGFGGTNVFETPYLDALATEGVLFTQAYSPAPTCAPSRSGIMSGRYPGRIDNTHVIGGEVPKPGSINSRMMDPYYSARLEVEEITIPEALKPHGYYSGHIGKWHMSVNHPAFPHALDQGFDFSRMVRGVSQGMPDRTTGFATTNAADPFQLQDIDGNPSTNGWARDIMMEAAFDYFDEAVTTHSNQPFFCYYASWLVHAPIHMHTERVLRKYAAKMGYGWPLDPNLFFVQGQANPYYAAMVERFDYNVHRIMHYLENQDDPRWTGHKLIENTYVFITSDNGGAEGADPHGFVTDNFPLDKGKSSTEEGGTRVPCIILGPDVKTNVITDVMMNGLDFYPTMMNLAGVTVTQQLDGLDLTGILLDDPQDPALVTNDVGEVRDTMYWHFPHGGDLTSTLRKDGWKITRKYDSYWTGNPYELHQLYDTNGAPVDVTEVNDLYNNPAHMSIQTQLIAELESWLIEIDASRPHLNPRRTANDLPNQNQVPPVLDTGHSNGVAWVTWDTGAGKAGVETVELIYTLNGDNSSEEEWFDLPVAFTSSAGYAATVIPDGTTHFVFTLVDSNNFLVHSYDAGFGNSSGKDSTRIPRYVEQPGKDALLVQAGTQFPTDDVIIANEDGATANSKVKDDDPGSETLAEGQTFTLFKTSELTRVSLKVAEDVTYGSGDHRMAFWLGNYDFGIYTPSVASEDTRVFEWIDFSNTSLTNNSFITIDFTDVEVPPGTYAFQLAWPADHPEHYANFYRGVAEYSEGERLRKSVPAGTSILLPFSGQTGPNDRDLVFVLHGTQGPSYGKWASDYGLGAINVNTAAHLNTVSSSGLLRGDEGWHKSSASAWTVTNGVLGNLSLSNNDVGEGAIAQIFDLSTYSNLDAGAISLQFDYSTGDVSENLFVHLWGYVENATPSTPTSFLMNLGAQNGNAWESSDSNSVVGTAGTFDDYNLGYTNGVWDHHGSGNEGQAEDAAVILTGSTGGQSYSNMFDLSGFTTAPDMVSGYDYLVLGFARDIEGATTPALTIRNLILSVAGGDTILEFVQGQPADDLMADPDGDLVVNLVELALGGDPTNHLDGGMSPIAKINPGGPGEYLYPRRLDAAALGLFYTVECCSNLQVGAWVTNGCVEVGASIIDAEFEEVTNQVDVAEDTTFVRLRMEIDE